MVTFRRHTSPPTTVPQPEDDAFLRLISLLIEALALHAVEYRPEHKRLFQESVRQIAAKLESAESPAEALVLGGEVIHSLQSYNREVETFVSDKAKEIQSIVAMLTNTVVQLCGTASTCPWTLVELERDLKGADNIKDVRYLKGRFSDHLKTMRRENEEQHRTSKEPATSATPATQGEPTRKTIVPVKDSVTGLATGRAAEAAIRDALASGVPLTPVVFVIERLQPIIERYGFAMGDEILKLFSQHLVERFPNKAIFRWRGPSFLVLLGQDGHGEIQKAVSGSLEHTVKTGMRSVFLPIRWTWTIIPVTPSSEVNLVVGEIDRFVGKQVVTPA